MSNKIADRMQKMNPSAVREIFKSLADPEVISFAGGNPSPATFPTKELEEISARLYADNPIAFLQYGITEGYAPLREQTLGRLKQKHSIGSDDDDIIITTGGEQAIDLCLKTLTNEGDTVLCEDPSFVGCLNDIRSYKTNLVGIPMDEYGMDIEALEKALQTEKNVKLIYTIPTFQNPMGVTMPLERRQKMYELAVKYDVMIMEDAPYFELRFDGEYVSCIKSLDKTGHVLFCGSYSKTVAPGLRVGYLIAPKSIFDKIVIAKQCVDVHTPVYTQMIIAEYLKNHDFDAHIAEACKLYSAQRDRMIQRLEEHLDKRIKFTRPEGGLFIWCTLPEGYSGYDFCMLGNSKKVACVPASAFDPKEWRDKPGVRINYSMPSFEQIDKGVELLGECSREFLNK